MTSSGLGQPHSGGDGWGQCPALFQRQSRERASPSSACVHYIKPFSIETCYYNGTINAEGEEIIPLYCLKHHEHFGTWTLSVRVLVCEPSPKACPGPWRGTEAGTDRVPDPWSLQRCVRKLAPIRDAGGTVPWGPRGPGRCHTG